MTRLTKSYAASLPTGPRSITAESSDVTRVGWYRHWAEIRNALLRASVWHLLRTACSSITQKWERERFSARTGPGWVKSRYSVLTLRCFQLLAFFLFRMECICL